MSGMGRREFVALLGGAAAAWPVAAHAQQPAMPLVGLLSARGPRDDPHLTAAILQGLEAASFIDGRTIAIEYRYADGRLDRLPALAADLVRRQPVMIVTLGGNDVSAAAKAATTTIQQLRCRSGDVWSRRQSWSAGRQSHGHQLICHRSAVGAAARCRAQGHSHRLYGEPGKFLC